MPGEHTPPITVHCTYAFGGQTYNESCSASSKRASSEPPPLRQPCAAERSLCDQMSAAARSAGRRRRDARPSTRRDATRNRARGSEDAARHPGLPSERRSRLALAPAFGVGPVARGTPPKPARELNRAECRRPHVRDDCGESSARTGTTFDFPRPLRHTRGGGDQRRPARNCPSNIHRLRTSRPSTKPP